MKASLVRVIWMLALAGDAWADSKQDSVTADPVAAVFQRMKHGVCVGNFERDQDLKAVAELDADYLDSVRDAGFSSIRFFFNNHKQPKFYATNVSHALKRGLVVNVCMFMFTKDRQQYVNRWREIATFYRDYPQELVFEMFNEPSLAPKLNDPTEVMDWINAAVAAIREVSLKRILLIGGPSYMQAPFLSKYVTPEHLTYKLPGGGFAEDRLYYAGLPRNSLMASWNILDTEFG